MTTTDTRPVPLTEFERIAELTIKATEAVAEELRTDGDAHTCVTATMSVFQPEIDRLKAEVEQLRARATYWHDTYQQHAGSFDEFLGELLALLPGAEDTGSDAYDQIPRAIEALRAQRNDALNLIHRLTSERDTVARAVRSPELSDAEKLAEIREAFAVVEGLRDVEATADAWVVPKVPINDNPHVRPRILANGLIRRDAGDSTPAHTLQYVGQLLAAVDEADARTKETNQ